MSKKRPNLEQEDKLQLAAKIAKQSSRVAHAYENVESSILRVLHWSSAWIDKILFNQKYSKLIAFLLAVMIYFVVNVSDSTFGNTTQSGYVIDSIPLTVTVDDSVYEVSGLPENVSASVIGDISDISMLRNSNTYKVVADLTGLGEGTHEIDLIPTDFSNRLRVSISPSKAVVTIRKKTTRRFTLSYDFVHTDELDAMYVLGTPTLSTTEVMVRASQDTIDQIAFVKALIDVSGKEESFSTEATLAAYDANGNKVNVNLIPSIVTVDVPISSPNKSVPVQIQPVGIVPNNMAIDKISLDHSAVILYGPDSVLSRINNLNIQVDATTLTENASYTATIQTPSGVNATSVSRVVMNVTLAQKVERVIDDVIIEVINNTNGYRFSLTGDQKASTSVKVYGSQGNVDALTAGDIRVIIDMENIRLGKQDITLSVSGNNPYVEYELTQPTITLEVIE